MLTQVQQEVTALKYNFVVTEAAYLAALAQLEEHTGWVPFLAKDGTRVIRPDRALNDRELSLPYGYLSITSVVFEYSSEFTYDTELTAMRWLHYRDDPQLPIIGILFDDFGPFSSPGYSVRVTGTLGYAETLPTDLITALAKRVILNISREADMTRLKQGPVEFEWGNVGGTQRQAWNLEWRQTISRYRRND